MTDLKDGLSSKSLLRTTGAVVLVLLLTHVCGGQLQRTPPKVVVMLGDDTVLPCQLEPPTNAVQMTIEWGRNDLNPRFVYVWHDGRELLTDQNEAYTGRASLDINKLKQGDISLRLSTVKVSDNGTYRCYLPKQSQEYFIDLVVGAVSSPTISLAGLDKSISAVVLECESKGWYPEPEVLWLDGEGNLLSAGPTETVRGPDDLYTVSSRVTVEKRHSNSFTCRVQQNKTNQTRETEIRIPDDFFKVQSSSSSVIIGLAVSLAVCVTLILLLVFLLWKRQNKNTKKIQRDEIDGKKNNSEGNKTEDQFITDGEREREMLMAETEQEREEQNERKEENNTQRSQELQEEQRRREDAEKQLQTMRNEVTEYLLLPFTDLQTLRKKLRDKMSELERIRAELVQYSRISQNSNKAELQKMKQEAEKETERLKEQLEKKETELQTKTKKFAAKQAEPQPRHENQRNREELQIIRVQLFILTTIFSSSFIVETQVHCTGCHKTVKKQNTRQMFPKPHDLMRINQIN
ncbi:butyrophilin subfamily 2 member A2 [Lates calcarifer]|uniref:Butyrophilin subfamily 2 member A2 n=1 Tax=Lates calcarifer TaxID=8187 RepID=A0AAJ8AZ50_LATCA|nr:butyrophilin subfamily 2 member A2 [Lates calcarifer]